jgi:hypothetical protein
MSAGLFFLLFISYPMTNEEYAVRRGEYDETDLKGDM